MSDDIDEVDGSDLDRVVNELLERGGADAAIGRFLREQLAEHFAAADPESCVND